MSSRRFNPILLAGICAIAVSAPAHAQSTGAPKAADADTGIREIVVTANRVETSAQKTPIALTVYSGTDLVDKGVTNILALQTIDPSVNVTSSTGGAYVAVRGIASTDLTEIGDPAVPIARDGFYTNRSYGIQATITFAIRASTAYDTHKGYRTITGIYTGQKERGDDADSVSGRIQAVWKPVDGFQIWASYQHDSIVGVGDVTYNTALGAVPATYGDGKTFTNFAPTSVSLTGDRVRWEARYDLLPGGFKFIYAGGYDVEDWHHSLDGTGVGDHAYPAYQQFIQHEHPKTWNHEARISNDANATVFVQAGYFHFQEVNALTSGLYNDAMQFPFSPGGPLAALSQAGKYGILFQYPSVYDRSDAVFGYLAWKVSDALKLSVGARNTWDHKTRQGTATLNLAALASPFIPAFANPPPTPGDGNISEHKATFHIGLDYTVAPHSLLYAKFDTGYKPGGFNSNGSAPSVPYGSETVSTFEIGSKNRFLDSRLQFNVDAFYSDYKGYQASQFTQALNGAAGVQNIGNAKIYGAEMQVVALFGTGGQFDVNAAALHTELGSGLAAVNGTTNATVVIGGNKLPNAPALSFTTGVQQDLAFPGGKLTARIEGKYSSSFYYSIFNSADARSWAYMTGNATLSYTPEHGGWKIQAYVRNFTDKLVLAHASENPTGNVNNYEFQPPRTFGISGSPGCAAGFPDEIRDESRFFKPPLDWNLNS
eukprot:gene12148-12234_t